jgi:hypothetical protein
MLFEPSGIVVQGSGIHALVINVSIEDHFLQAAVKRLFLGAIQNYRRLAPETNPKSIIGSWTRGAHFRRNGSKGQGEQYSEHKTLFHVEPPIPPNTITSKFIRTLAFLSVPKNGHWT